MRHYNLFFIACILAGACCTFPIYAQSSGSSGDKIAEVYGTFVEQLNADQLAWINNCLDRCSIVEEPYIEGETIKNLSVIPLNTKYVATVISDTDYDAATFNPLKYNIDFFHNNDQYFRIFDSGYVLKVGKKE